jgi:hypothetical protein
MRQGLPMIQALDRLMYDIVDPINNHQLERENGYQELQQGSCYWIR